MFGFDKKLEQNTIKRIFHLPASTENRSIQINYLMHFLI